MLVLILGGIGAWWINGTMPANGSDTTYKTFSINKGEGVRQVANNLKTQGFIRDSIVFFLMVRQLGLDGKIQAGEFRISSSMNAEQIANTLQTATNDLRVTIPEGKRAEEIADILSTEFPNFDNSWRSQLVAKEGYLFPDTYSFPKDATIDTIISTMTNNYKTKYESLQGGRKKDLTEKEIVTIASLVEREARHDEDRPLVASVILNRYAVGMKLDIDATIQYALGYDTVSKRWWKENLSLDDLALNSPYNTYKVSGLPPTPISNPGLKALEAVVNPATTDYIFYISDKNGVNHYATTNDEQEANKKKYGL